MAGKRGKQERIPGTEDPRLADVDKAFDDYKEANDEWSETREKIIKAKDLLLIRMKDHGLTTYKRDGLIAKRSNKDALKLEKVKSKAD